MLKETCESPDAIWTTDMKYIVGEDDGLPHRDGDMVRVVESIDRRYHAGQGGFEWWWRVSFHDGSIMDVNYRHVCAVGANKGEE